MELDYRLEVFLSNQNQQGEETSLRDIYDGMTGLGSDSMLILLGVNRKGHGRDSREGGNSSSSGLRTLVGGSINNIMKHKMTTKFGAISCKCRC